MPVKFFKIMSKKNPYRDGDKPRWLEVGTLFEKDGKMNINLNMFPNENFYVFEQEDKRKQGGETEEAPF